MGIGSDVLDELDNELLFAGPHTVLLHVLDKYVEEDHHLVEPRGIGGREVQGDLASTLEPLLDLLGFVDGQLVHDDV